jgi:hypothetical protein
MHTSITQLGYCKIISMLSHLFLTGKDLWMKLLSQVAVSQFDVYLVWECTHTLFDHMTHSTETAENLHPWVYQASHGVQCAGQSVSCHRSYSHSQTACSGSVSGVPGNHSVDICSPH